MVDFASISRIGERAINEDCMAVVSGAHGLFCILADGLGGHGGGQIASRLATQACIEVYNRGALSGRECLSAAAEAAQSALLEEQQRTGQRDTVKSTLVLLHLEGDTAQWAHVGDSRLYLFFGGKLITRTLDHSVPQMLVQQGTIRERAIRFHEDRNRLLRVVGTPWDSPRHQLSEPVQLVPGQRFLLCSDGFWEWVLEKDMLRLLKISSGPADWLQQMEAVLQKSGSGKHLDNYTAIAVWVR